MKGALKGVTAAVSNVNDVVVGLKEGRGTAGMLLSDDALASDVRRTVTAAGSSVRDIAADLQNGRGAAGMLLRDEAVAGQIREAVANARAATADLGRATRKADALMTDLSSRQIPKKAGELVDHLRDSAQHIHQITSDISKPDQAGMSAGANIRVIAHQRQCGDSQSRRRDGSGEAQFPAARFLQQEGVLQPGGYLPGRVSPGWGLHQSLEPANLAVRLGAVPERVKRGGAVREGKGAPARRLSHSAASPLQDAPSSSKATQTAAFPPMSSGSPAAVPWRSGNTSRSGSSSIQRISESCR